MYAESNCFREYYLNNGKTTVGFIVALHPELRNVHNYNMKVVIAKTRARLFKTNDVVS